MFEDIVLKIKQEFPGQDFIPLHSPNFSELEKEYVLDCINSTFVSSVGEYVNRFESEIAEYTGSMYSVAIVNGTSALHLALKVLGVQQKDEVITQSFTFIATANAIRYCGAEPIFLDIGKKTLGLSPEKLNEFLHENAVLKDDGFTYNKHTNNRIAACVPMHTFGHPCEIDKIIEIAKSWNIKVIEDAAESIGSYYQGKHTGIFGDAGVFSFNGNKTITCGGGGIILFKKENHALSAKHLSTQAKINHPWNFNHDEIAYNYRMPNLNAAMACAQLKRLPEFIAGKRALAKRYQAHFTNLPVEFFSEPSDSKSNYWLNAILFKDHYQKEKFLDFANSKGVMCRPAWNLIHTQKMYRGFIAGALENSEDVFNRLVNIPSSFIPEN